MRTFVARLLASSLVVVIVASFAISASGEIQGLLLVAGDPDIPDPIDTLRLVHCQRKPDHVVGPGFSVFDHPDNRRVADDTDLLVSLSLTDTTAVTTDEKRRFLECLDDSLHNVLGLSQTDLQLVYNYFCATSAYDTSGVEGNMEIFPHCSDSIRYSDRDHVDIYLMKKGTDLAYGHPYSSWCDPLEDEPRYDPDSLEYAGNSLEATDGGGNAASSDASWIRFSANGVLHEFTHKLWDSNGAQLGSTNTASSDGDMDELFACAAALLAGPARGTVGGDLPYGQSLLHLYEGVQGTGAFCHPVWGISGPNCPADVDQEECRRKYESWALWAAYLAQRFHDTQNFTNDLMHRWTHYTDPTSGKLMRDMCGLAAVLGDADYSYLAGATGGERLSRVFRDFGIAKWVNSESYESAYRLTDEFSPVDDLGLFIKVDTVPPPDGTHNCWELAVPPRFLLGSAHDGVMWSVPGSASECGDDGWNDPVDTTYCYNEYCDPVKVRLWGSDYISFVADTTYYSCTDHRLKVEFDWSESGVSDGTELWISALEYGCAPDTVYRCGSQLKDVSTYRFSPSDTTAAYFDFVWFGETLGGDGAEAVTFILSVVQTDYDYHDYSDDNCDEEEVYETACLKRTTADPYDVEYGYSFGVYDYHPGGGCPYVHVDTAAGDVADNNILAGGKSLSEIEDAYLLGHEPNIENGTYALRIAEHGDDVSYINVLSLSAVDHPKETAVCVADVGEGPTILTYVKAGQAVDCSGVPGANDVSLVSEADGVKALLPAGDELTVILGDLGRSAGGIGVTGGPGTKIPDPLFRSVAGASAADVSLAALCRRANTATSVLPLAGLSPSDGSLAIQLSAPTDYYIDELFWAEFLDVAPVVTECPIASSRHSVEGECGSDLMADDKRSVVIGPGDTLDIAFEVPELEQGYDRDLLLSVTGRYEAAETNEAVSSRSAVDASPVLRAYPNPFGAESRYTRIAFDVPPPGGIVSVDVFNVAGRQVRALGAQDLRPGRYEVHWDGSGDDGQPVAAGVYFYKIQGQGLRAQKKVVVLR